MRTLARTLCAPALAAFLASGATAQDRPAWVSTLTDIVSREATTKGFPSFASVEGSDVAQGIMQRPSGSTWAAPVFDLGMSPAGDLYASMSDMASFMVSLLDEEGRVATPRTLRSMWTPSPPRETWNLDVDTGPRTCH